MPRIKFIGNYDIAANGKFLLEILSQLRNFGVGRLVTKNEWLRRFPTQPSFITVRKVEPEMDRWMRHATVYGDWIYRGKLLGLFRFGEELNRSDWRLIHRNEEDNFRRCEQPFTMRRLPAQIPYPPLLRYQFQQQLKEQNKCSSQSTPMIHLVQHFDPEFDMLRQHTELASSLNPPLAGTIYDVDPNIYLSLHGNELPLKVEYWGDERTLTSGVFA